VRTKFFSLNGLDLNQRPGTWSLTDTYHVRRSAGEFDQVRLLYKKALFLLKWTGSQKN
jgi:hypothetical protein